MELELSSKIYGAGVLASLAAAWQVEFELATKPSLQLEPSDTTLVLAISLLMQLQI